MRARRREKKSCPLSRCAPRGRDLLLIIVRTCSARVRFRPAALSAWPPCVWRCYHCVLLPFELSALPFRLFRCSGSRFLETAFPPGSTGFFARCPAQPQAFRLLSPSSPAAASATLFFRHFCAEGTQAVQSRTPALLEQRLHVGGGVRDRFGSGELPTDAWRSSRARRERGLRQN